MSGARKARRRGLRSAGWWREVILNAGAVLGVMCLVMTIAGLVFGLTPLVFRSGSMAPAIGTGDLAVARSVSAGDVGVGDIVSVTNREGVRLTHRVQAVEPFGNEIRLTLKGDANAAPDAETYTVTSVDKVMFAVLKLGYAVSWATGPFGVFAGGIFVACVAFVAFTPSRRPKGARKATAVLVVAGMGLGGFLTHGRTTTLAAFTDNATMTTAAFTARTLTPPPSIGCTAQSGLLSTYVDLTWTPTSTAFAHRITVTTGTTTKVLGADVPAGTSTRRMTVSEVTSLLPGLGGTVTVRVYATSGATWISAGSASRTVTLTSLVILGLDIRC